MILPPHPLPLPPETVSRCHSEASAEESDTKCHPERSEGSHEFLRYAQDKLHGVYPEPTNETLRYTQGDKCRRVQNDSLPKLGATEVAPTPLEKSVRLETEGGWRDLKSNF